MKKKFRILALILAMALSLSLVLSSCGGDDSDKDSEKDSEKGSGNIRYTITEKEWKQIQKEKPENVTIRCEQYVGEESEVYIIKYADGYACFCKNEKPYGSSQGGVTNSAVASTKSHTHDGTVDSKPSTSNSGATGSSTGGYGIIVDNKPSNSTAFGSSYGSIDIKPTGSVIIMDSVVDKESSSVIYTPIVFNYPNIVLLEKDCWIYMDFVQQITQFGEYIDKSGRLYTFNKLISDMGSGCTIEYEGEKYVELLVKNESGKEVTKWVKVETQKNATETKNYYIEFSELKYDEKEKAYVYAHSDENGNFKCYMYFENGKLVKSITFGGLAKFDDKDKVEGYYDVSDVTPKNLISEDYMTLVDTYQDYGKTKVDHNFSIQNAVTKIN